MGIILNVYRSIICQANSQQAYLQSRDIDLAESRYILYEVVFFNIRFKVNRSNLPLVIYLFGKGSNFPTIVDRDSQGFGDIFIDQLAVKFPFAAGAGCKNDIGKGLGLQIGKVLQRKVVDQSFLPTRYEKGHTLVAKTALENTYLRLGSKSR